jgi:hypothetical protein
MKTKPSDFITVPHSKKPDRQQFIGGSDARIIMSHDEEALIRLWREKRGEAEPEDLSGNLIVQLGVVTEALNQTWYERNTGRVVTDIQRWVRHPVHRYLAATLDGFVNDLDAVFEAKFMLPWSFSEEAAAEKHMDGPTPAQHVGDQRPVRGPLDHHRRGQMDRDDHTGRRALPTLSGHGRAPVLALRPDRPDPNPLWDRASAASDRRGSHRRHERVEFMGRVRRPLLRHPLRLPRP